jgi:adenine-specific DNA methylase
MKYMGSKRAMLQNGLGELLNRESGSARRFVDLFAGSGAVAIHVARKFPIPVLAFDLQQYSSVLTGAVIERQAALNCQSVWSNWECAAIAKSSEVCLPAEKDLTRAVVSDYRLWSGQQSKLPITKAYGGYYFGPRQAVLIDSFLATMPNRGRARQVGLAALVQTASRCAAAPGHTAQPFQPTRKAKPFIKDAWSKDVVQLAKAAFSSLGSLFAQQRGEAKVLDANLAAKELRPGDIAFIDPPYSGVHYSRFYHVLESIARCENVEVFGEGRYPAPELRPWSRYSVQTEASSALRELLETISSRGAKAIITFPHDKCSNGLSGYKVRRIAEEFFHVERASVSSRLSTLGGRGDSQNNEAGRAARRQTRELMLVLKPK